MGLRCPSPSVGKVPNTGAMGSVDSVGSAMVSGKEMNLRKDKGGADLEKIKPRAVLFSGVRRTARLLSTADGNYCISATQTNMSVQGLFHE